MQNVLEITFKRVIFGNVVILICLSQQSLHVTCMMHGIRENNKVLIFTGREILQEFRKKSHFSKIITKFVHRLKLAQDVENCLLWTFSVSLYPPRQIKFIQQCKIANHFVNFRFVEFVDRHIYCQTKSESLQKNNFTNENRDLFK